MYLVQCEEVRIANRDRGQKRLSNHPCQETSVTQIHRSHDCTAWAGSSTVVDGSRTTPARGVPDASERLHAWCPAERPGGSWRTMSGAPGALSASTIGAPRPGCLPSWGDDGGGGDPTDGPRPSCSPFRSPPPRPRNTCGSTSDSARI